MDTTTKTRSAAWGEGSPLRIAAGNPYGPGSGVPITNNGPSPLEAAGMINQFVPVTGDIQSGLMAINDLKNRDYGSAALNGLGVLPFLPSLGGVVKNKGGNWLSSGVDKALHGMIYPEGAAAEFSKNTQKPWAYIKNAASNKFVNGQIRNYVMNKMGTMDDPIRKLVDEGVSHVDTYNATTPRHFVPHLLRERRAQAGFPEQGVANTPSGSLYEYYADNAARVINRQRALEDVLEDMPIGQRRAPEWILNAPEDQKYLTTDNTSIAPLGFDHMIDYLRMEMDAGNLKPDQIKNMSIEDVVRKTHAWNEAMKKAAEAEKLRGLEMNGQMGTLVKDYPDEGFRWVDLNKPEKIDPADYEKYRVRQSLTDGKWRAYDLEDNVIRGSTSGLDANGMTPEEAWLAGQLHTEGNLMGHCVGGYCDEVVNRGKKIISLRDARHEPHVTIETGPVDAWLSGDRLKEILPDEQAKHVWSTYMAGILRDKRGAEAKLHDVFKELYPEEYAKEFSKKQIHQIKGKGNSRPDEKYQKFISDYIKENGPWADIRDLHNTNITREELEKLNRASDILP